MNFLRLYNLINKQLLLLNETSNNPVDAPVFYQGDNISVQYCALENYVAGLNTSPTLLGVTSYSVKMGLYTTDGTELARQNTWAATIFSGDLKAYIATFSQNSTTVTAALAGKSVGEALDCLLEIELTSGSNTMTSLLAETSIVKTALT